MKRKILKIIQVVYDILSLGFIIFISIALAVAPKVDGQVKNNESPSSLVDRKSKSNLIVGDNRSIAYISDFLSDDFIIGSIQVSNVLTDYIGDHSKNSKQIVVGEGYNNVVPKYPRVTSWNNVNYNNFTCGGTEDVNWTYLHNIYIVVDNGSYISNSNVSNYGINFYFRDDLEGNIFHFNITLFFKGDVSYGITNYGVSLRYNSIVVDKSYVGNYLTVIFSNDSLLGTLLNSSNSDDFSRGYDIGKQEGFYQGVVEGSKGVQTNVFTAIGQAFSVIANIFSIELLPGFPLWILVFTPLIVAVVIVVVKMIKG